LNEGAREPNQARKPNQAPLPHPIEDGALAARERLRRLAWRARLILAFERVWPPVAWAATIVLAFLACSWFGLWFVTPPAVRAFGVALVAGARVVAR
jgi:hypothetical protein